MFGFSVVLLCSLLLYLILGWVVMNRLCVLCILWVDVCLDEL